MNERLRRIEDVRLELGDFLIPLDRIQGAAKAFGDALALQQATWEPHDWSDFA